VLATDGRVITATFTGSGAAPPRDFPRRHDLFRTPELVDALFARHGVRLTRHAEWSDPAGTDRLALCELS
jgi:sugar phosphate isomerase/epimerase